ncbi:MAG: ATP-binding protein [Gemmatimonadales bacterium]
MPDTVERPPDEDHRFRVELATDLSVVGEVVETVCESCCRSAPVSRRTQFRLRTVLAEALANAMLYGNGGDPTRQVVVDVELREDGIVIAVSDEGNGFAHNAVPLPFWDDSLESTRGRGLFMIHRLADDVAFNDQGNTIWMTLPRH